MVITLAVDFDTIWDLIKKLKIPSVGFAQSYYPGKENLVLGKEALRHSGVERREPTGRECKEVEHFLEGGNGSVPLPMHTVQCCAATWRGWGFRLSFELEPHQWLANPVLLCLDDNSKFPT